VLSALPVTTAVGRGGPPVGHALGTTRRIAHRLCAKVAVVTADDGLARWFNGADGRNPAEVRYLGTLREAAARAQWEISPDQTESAHTGIPLYVSVEISAMKPFRADRCAPSLEAELWPADSIYGVRLEGCWGTAATRWTRLRR
jgi:hypothetical protein